ncbi:FAD-binding oxidoreductase [Modestobacter marinus]|uniref:FAD-binding oxidoreductase n=1 Tax=Modestobacter marinus TaxID=477641 RepID=UPI0021BBDE67|nr:FAD-binding oxidoreductase [Modestobacter marinus]
MIDRRPAVIVRCGGPADVARAVAFAREHDLVLSVRGGGHGVAGNAVCDGGILLDLSPVKDLHVDPLHRTARAGAGLTLGELDIGTQRHGLATPLGVVSVTGIAGLTLGGGLGWLNGRYGLACDNLIEAEVVTADGDLLQVGPESHPDLIWALRGGGGNFGVVTAFSYRLHPVGPVLAGGLGYPWAKVRDVLRFHEELVTTSPDELSTAVSIGIDPSGQPTVEIAVCWCGPHEDGERVLAPLRAFGPPLTDTIGSTSYVALQSAGDAGFPTGRQHYWKSGWMRTLTDSALETLIEHVPQMPSSMSKIGLQRMHGTASRVAPDATAFRHRADQYDFLMISQWEDPLDSERNIAWTRGLFDAMTPHLQEAVYVNNLGAEGPDRVRAAYGANYPRLAEVKRRYDPANVFRLNQNIAPGSDPPGSRP